MNYRRKSGGQPEFRRISHTGKITGGNPLLEYCKSGGHYLAIAAATTILKSVGARPSSCLHTLAIIMPAAVAALCLLLTLDPTHAHAKMLISSTLARHAGHGKITRKTPALSNLTTVDDAQMVLSTRGPPPVKYVCEDGKCVLNTRGLPPADCTQICIARGPSSPPAPPPSFPPGPIGNMTYLSYYTVGLKNISGYKLIHGDDYTMPGAQGTEPGTNVAVIIRHIAGLGNLDIIRHVWADHKVPSFYTPDSWMVSRNTTNPLKSDWKQALARQARALRPLIKSGAIRGIFYGDEIGCHGMPFWAFDAVTSFFRGLLGEDDGLIHHTTECQPTLGCPPAPATVCKVACPGPCGPTSPPASRSLWDAIYWPHIPPALNSIGVDVYSWPDTGISEVTRTQEYYESYVFPKLGKGQSVWIVPGLFAPIKAAASYNQSLQLSVSDAHFFNKMAAYATWTAADHRIVGWMPFHYYNRLWSPTPDSGSWGAEVMPKTLEFIQDHAPLPLKTDDKPSSSPASLGVPLKLMDALHHARIAEPLLVAGVLTRTLKLDAEGPWLVAGRERSRVQGVHLNLLGVLLHTSIHVQSTSSILSALLLS
jgi:hypothetical protein